MRVLITGITGMVGSHLAEYALEQGAEVHGLVRWRSPLDNIAGIIDRVKLHYGDLRDLTSLLPVVREAKPERVFHLAAQSFVPTSFIAPSDTMETNAIGTLNLLEAIRMEELDSMPDERVRIHICSSSEVYGQVDASKLPITEDHPFHPASPYGVSKVAADMFGEQYFKSYGMHVLRTRMFTHTGARRGRFFAESSFARQIARIEAGLQDGPILVGNLDSIRTYADVRDAVRAYWLLLEKCPPGEVYNIGGDTTLTVGDMLDWMKGIATATSKVYELDNMLVHSISPSLMRPSDVTQQIPDSSKFRSATGWKPEHSLDNTLRSLLEWHRERVRLP